MSKFFRNGVQGYVRAGLKQRTRIDPRRIMLSAYMKSTAIPASSAMPSNYVKGYGVGALGNLSYGDCAYAAPGHLACTVRLNNGRGDMVTEEQVLAEYKTTGWDPEIDATDNGAYLLDVMKQWKNRGLFGTKIAAFVELDPRDQAEVEFAVSNMGGAIFAFGLPVSAQDQEVWEAKADRSLETADDLPWSWGGHAVYCCDASPGRNAGITWGERKSWTAAWQDRYAYEAYAVVLEEAVNSGRSPVSGLDLAGLLIAADAVGRL
jgi:hypothetical protein